MVPDVTGPVHAYMHDLGEHGRVERGVGGRGQTLVPGVGELAVAVEEVLVFLHRTIGGDQVAVEVTRDEPAERRPQHRAVRRLQQRFGEVLGEQEHLTRANERLVQVRTARTPASSDW
jgi:exoribonuclease R